ncbi:hypothetical protein HZ326_8146 [Fusarium oxysporum f. sp. albedinis]|nr:hypothetical protein HZ326_8146 [Fusarium oxysporum f. sp. albedinis]
MSCCPLRSALMPLMIVYSPQYKELSFLNAKRGRIGRIFQTRTKWNGPGIVSVGLVSTSVWQEHISQYPCSAPYLGHAGIIFVPVPSGVSISSGSPSELSIRDPTPHSSIGTNGQFPCTVPQTHENHAPRIWWRREAI